MNIIHNTVSVASCTSFAFINAVRFFAYCFFAFYFYYFMSSARKGCIAHSCTV